MVSGSPSECLPKIPGILKNLRKEITTMFQFSNKVVETSFETLLKGNIQTTFGTDFNCIAQSILERGFIESRINDATAGRGRTGVPLASSRSNSKCP